MEKMPPSIPDSPERKSESQKKLEALLVSLQSLEGSRDEGIIEPDIIEAAITANKQRIAELKAEHPELNN